MLYIGCHLSASGGNLEMVKTAQSIGANTFAFFTRNPRGVEWSTSNAFVAVVKDGVVTAKGYGSCEIIAKYGRIESRAYVLVLE